MNIIPKLKGITKELSLATLCFLGGIGCGDIQDDVRGKVYKNFVGNDFNHTCPEEEEEECVLANVSMEDFDVTNEGGYQLIKKEIKFTTTEDVCVSVFHSSFNNTDRTQVIRLIHTIEGEDMGAYSLLDSDETDTEAKLPFCLNEGDENTFTVLNYVKNDLNPKTTYYGGSVYSNISIGVQDTGEVLERTHAAVLDPLEDVLFLDTIGYETKVSNFYPETDITTYEGSVMFKFFNDTNEIQELEIYENNNLVDTFNLAPGQFMTRKDSFDDPKKLIFRGNVDVSGSFEANNGHFVDWFDKVTTEFHN